MTNEIEEESHHIFCNYQRGSVSECKQCKSLRERFPKEMSGEEIIERYFPEVKIIC